MLPFVLVENHAAAPMNRLHSGKRYGRRRCREHFAARGAVGQVLANEAGKQRFMPASAADEKGDLSLRNIGPHDAGGVRNPRQLNTLDDAGLKIVLGTPTAAPPRWLMDEYPDVAPVDDEGPATRVWLAAARRRCPARACAAGP